MAKDSAAPVSEAPVKASKAAKAAKSAPTGSNGVGAANRAQAKAAIAEEFVNPTERPTHRYGPAFAQDLDDQEDREVQEPEARKPKRSKAKPEADEQDEPKKPERRAPRGEERTRPEAKEPVDDEEPEHVWPEYLLDKAREHGFEQDDFTSPAAMRKAIAKAEKRETRREERQESRHEEKEFDLYEGLDRKSLEAEYGESITKLLDRLHGHGNQRIEQLVGVIEHLMDDSSRRNESDINSMFDGLNDEFDGAFGDESEDALGPDSLEVANRMEAFKIAAKLADGRPNKKHLRQAARALGFGGRKQRTAREEVSADIQKKLEARARNTLGAPSNGSGEPTDHREAGIRDLRRLMK